MSDTCGEVITSLVPSIVCSEEKDNILTNEEISKAEKEDNIVQAIIGLLEKNIMNTFITIVLK